MKYFQEINKIREHFGLTWAELAKAVGSDYHSFYNSVNSLDRKERKRQPLAWNFAIWLFGQVVKPKDTIEAIDEHLDSEFKSNCNDRP